MTIPLILHLPDQIKTIYNMTDQLPLTGAASSGTASSGISCEDTFGAGMSAFNLG